MKTTISSLAFVVMTILGAQSQSVKTKKNTIVIIPGAWSGADDWELVISNLKSLGNDAIVVNLAGHGDDKTPISTISLNGYVEEVKKAIGERTNIILVGHSFGGVILTQIAANIPSQIKKLIYVAAYVPKNGESLLSLATKDADSHLGKYLQVKEKEGIAAVSKEGIIDAFFADAPKKIQDFKSQHFKAEPLAPLATPVHIMEDTLKKMEKVYVFTADDHTNSPALQHQMVLNNGIVKTYTLPSSHTPFVSMPDVVAGILNHEAK